MEDKRLPEKPSEAALAARLAGMMGNSIWEEFAARHPGHRFIQLEDLYSLSVPLIDAIKRRAGNVFADGDESFELELARAAPAGFFRKQPVGGKGNWTAASPEEVKQINEKAARAQAKIRAKQAIEVGMDPEDFRSALDRESNLTRLMHERQESYFGWLVTQREYWDELEVLKKAHEGEITARGAFPALARYYPHFHWVRPADGDILEQEFQAFYAKWGLDTLLTWDVPRPLLPTIGPAADFPAVVGPEGRGVLAGPALYAPWYFLRDESLHIADLFRTAKFYAPSMLGDWFKQAGQREGSKGVGSERLRNYCFLYRNFHLVLRRRYADRLKDNLGKLVSAFIEAIEVEQGRVVGFQSLQRLCRKFEAALATAQGKPASDQKAHPVCSGQATGAVDHRNAERRPRAQPTGAVKRPSKGRR